MYIIPIAWLYVALMMSVAEATNSNGTVLGAIFTFILYGLLPIGLMLYFMGTPARKRKIRAREASEREAAIAAHAATTAAQANTLVEPDASGLPPADSVAPVRKEA
ncbi:MAG: hypothetical protein EAZ11_08220 [Curvibacter sp.]|nr:MAG: hypothetical protein EAZ11_08220 [Curvibacter sp.]